LRIPPLGTRGLVILGLLLVVNILNFVDRLLPSILVEAIRLDLRLTDSQIGLMGGVAFAVIYSFATLGLARIADRRSPRLVLALSLGFWSLATAVSGLAQSFLQLFFARAAVAAGEAGSAPAAHALIARVFPGSRRSSALAIFSLGVPIGAMLGLALGGWINDLLNWRSAFFVVGLPGLVVAAVLRFFIPDPPHQSPDGARGERLSGTLRLLFGMRSFRHMAIASSLFAIGSYALNIFAAAFLIRTHHMSAARAGLAFGLAFGVGGLVGTFAGGMLSDWLGQKDPRWRQGVPAVGLALSAPVSLAAFLADSTAVSVVCLTFTYLLGLLYFAPTFATAQSLAPDSARATASGVILFCLTLVGASVGPYAVGLLSDLLAPRFGAMSLRYAMSVLPLTMIWSAMHFLIAARSLPDDLDQATRRSQATFPAAVPEPS
jgi:MFS transporter, Spinster family, sphingosine-1-phosphate transporter